MLQGKVKRVRKKGPKLNGKGRMLVTVWITPELDRAWELAAKFERITKSELVSRALGRIKTVKEWL